jgi:hypothetical protein
MRNIRKQPYKAKCTEAMPAKTHQIMTALRELQNQGFAVVEINVGAGQPVIEVIPCNRTAQMLADGSASVGAVAFHAAGVTQHQGWTNIGGCRVIWHADGYPTTERIHHGFH